MKIVTIGLLLAAPLAAGCGVPDEYNPVLVVGLEPAKHIVAGKNHTCAILKNGDTACWGDNQAGQIGDSPIKGHNAVRSPKRVKLDVEPTLLVAGPRHTCALFADGNVDCWGDDRFGWLGVKSTLDCAAPTTSISLPTSLEPCAVPPSRVLNVHGATALAGGGLTEETDAALGFACFVRDGDTVECWGDNRQGALGTEPEDLVRQKPVQVFDENGFPLRHIARLSAGAGHACAANAEGDVWCWGRDTRHKDPGSSLGAVRVQGVSNAIDVAAGGQHSCAALSTGRVMCWGSNNDGQSNGIGGGIHNQERIPVTEVEGVKSAKAIVAGEWHSCALLIGGDVVCWGSNEFGQHGDKDVGFTFSATRAKLSTTAIEIAAGRAHTCALTTDGEVFCWGKNSLGQLGTGE